MNEEKIIFNVLLDFLRELPEDFDQPTTTLAQASDMIIQFMEKHGLKDVD